MTQNAYRRPIIGARDEKRVVAPVAPAAEKPAAPRVFTSLSPQKPGSTSAKVSSYPSWLIPANPDSPSSYPKFQATFIGGSPCSGTFHQIT